jgi:hypothetical protein
MAFETLAGTLSDRRRGNHGNPPLLQPLVGAHFKVRTHP